MKIGSIDVSVATVAYSAGVVAALIADVTLWAAKADVRREAWHRSTILQAMYDENMVERGVTVCESLAASYPSRTHLRLYLANLYYRQKRFADAEAAFAEAAKSATATPQEKAWALVGQGASVFAAGKGKPKAAAEKAEPLFAQALAVDKECTDAIIALAIVNMWKGGAAGVKAAEERCKQALAAPKPGSLHAQQQLYAVSGLVELQNGRAAGATTDFLRARAVEPSTTQMDDYRRTALLGAAVQEGVDGTRRKELLVQCEQELKHFGKDQVTALNALGYGWWMLRNDPLLAAAASGAGKAAPAGGAAGTGALTNAQARFTKAMDTDVKDPRAYYNMAGLLETSMAETAAKSSVPLAGFGEGKAEVAVNPWTGEAKQPVRVPTADMPHLQEIVKRLKEEIELWKRFLLKANPGPPEKLDAKLRQLACYRRQAALQEGVNNSERQMMLSQSVTLAQEILKQHPESADGHFSYGRVLLDKGDFAGALKEFKEAQAKGLKTPALERLLQGVGQQPEALDVRPSPDRRWFGSRPLIACTLKTVSSAGPLKRVAIKVGQKALNAALIGSQVLCLPGANDVMDGDQLVTIEATDALGNAVEFPPLKFAVDRRPPTCRADPDAGATVTPKQVFKISLSDASGIDYTSVKVVLKPLGKSAAGATRTLIDEGKYKINMAGLNPPRKPGFMLDSDSFVVEPGLQDMSAGEWELGVTAQDMAGNLVQETKKYSVK
jgi:tetratricopeptide (TPR) repeat protein